MITETPAAANAARPPAIEAPKRIVGAVLFAALLTASASFGQANYSESFQGVGDGNDAAGGPPSLVSKGWIFHNQSKPAGTGVSPYWTEYPPGWGQDGSPLGHGGFAVWQNSSSKISAWAVMPAIPNQQSGDPLSIWTSAPTDAFGTNNATLELRYASSGTSTGSNENDVGNFTQVLATISAAGGHPWTQHQVTLPGSGRVAMRLIIGPGNSSQAFNGSILVDSLQVGTPAPPPYAMPVAGQTVHWTIANSPVLIAPNGVGQNPKIVAGGTVIVDAGVEVKVAANAALEVAGTIQLAGSGSANVLLRGPGSISVKKGGALTAAFADVELFTNMVYGGKVSFSDSNFRDPAQPIGFSYDSAGDIGHRFFDGILDYDRQIVNLERCTFAQGCSVSVLRGWLAARDCTFLRGQVVTNNPGPVGGEAMLVVGNSILDNVTVTDGYIDLMQDNAQHRFIGNVTVTGNAYGPGIRLEGGASYLIDPSVTLQGNKWPVNFGGNSAGILPGSVLPQKGNQFNEIPDTDDPSPSDERVVWADAGIPYAHLDNSTLHGQVTILPGVTVKIGPDVSFFFDTDSNGLAMPVFLGEPGRPIRFTPYTPGTKWLSLPVGGTKWFGTRWDWCIFEGCRYGVGVTGAPLAIDNSVFQDNARAVYTENYFMPRKCTFENNLFSISGERFAPLHEVRGFLDANHPTNPNTFINNHGDANADFFGSFLPQGGLIAKARHNSLENTDSDVRNNWWGTPTGPKHPVFNPGGLGDEVFFGIDAGGFLMPFLTTAPTDNPPPVVRFVTPGQNVVPGEQMALQWTTQDDGTIAQQRVYYSPDSNIDSNMQLLATVGASVRSYEWTVPAIGTPANGTDQFFRVIAVDNLGQEGIADLPLKITNPSLFSGTMTPGAVPGLVRPGDKIDACATASGDVGSMYASLELDNDESGVSLGGVFFNNGSACTILGVQIPDVSTDRARLRFDATASLNQVKSFYGPYFSIRPDPMLGDAAPEVAITSVSGGQTVPGGSTVVINWTAADDEGLRAFDIRASFDGGARWFIVARDLPGSARSYSWKLAASAGVSNARVRVVAKDLRFQNTSAESGSFSIAPGDTVPVGGPVGDITGDGFVNIDDLLAVINGWGACPLPPAACPADIAPVGPPAGNGVVNIDDLLLVINNWG